MSTYTVTKTTGGKTQPMLMTVAAPEPYMPPEQMRAFAPGGHLNSLFLADLLSVFLAHKRCGVHLYRSVMAQTRNEVWREKYREFLSQTEEHVCILEDLVIQWGGNPMYVSPAARLDELQNSKLMEPVLLTGSFDSITSELAGLEAVLIAEQKCHANWSLLSRLVRGLTDGESVRILRQAVNQVESQEDDHVHWVLFHLAADPDDAAPSGVKEALDGKGDPRTSRRHHRGLLRHRSCHCA